MITLPQLVLLLAFIALYQLYRNRSKQNMFHLDYLLYHVGIAILILIIYNYYLIISKQVNIFNIINLLHIVSLMVFFMHIDSTLKGYKAPFKKIYLLALTTYLLVLILNENGFYFINFQTRQTSILQFEIKNSKIFTDRILLKHLIIIPLVLNGIFNFYKNIEKSTLIKRKRNYSFWFYSYSLLFLMLAVLNSFSYFGLFDTKYDDFFYNLIRIGSLIQFVYFIFYPSFLNYLPTIKIENQTNNLDFYRRIENLFVEERVYLDQSLRLHDIRKKTGMKESEIRSLIKSNTGKSFNDFVNEYRVIYAKELIDENYFLKKTVISLARDSGFGSHHSFFRAFKKKFNTTPKKLNK